MSCKIYCIEDINGLKYVGSTITTLKQRFMSHKSSRSCSSKKLDLDNCEIKLLEICPIERRNEVEQYWIDRIDCVNQNNTSFDKKQYYLENKEKLKKYKKEYDIKNKEKLKQYWKEHDRKKYQYQSTWGGSMSSNNLLRISVDIFQ